MRAGTNATPLHSDVSTTCCHLPRPFYSGMGILPMSSTGILPVEALHADGPWVKWRLGYHGLSQTMTPNKEKATETAEGQDAPPGTHGQDDRATVNKPRCGVLFKAPGTAGGWCCFWCCCFGVLELMRSSIPRQCRGLQKQKQRQQKQQRQKQRQKQRQQNQKQKQQQKRPRAGCPPALTARMAVPR